MKKKRIVLLIIAILLVVTGCKSTKKSITTDKCIETMQENNFIISDIKETQFSDNPEIKQALVATDKSYSYQIEFYELTDNSSAKTLFDRNKLIFENSKSSNSSYISVELNNYNKYTLKASGQYKVISRI